MSCGDVLTIEDLRIAKRHQVFEAEVITGKAGGVAGGADIDYATNPNTNQTQKTLPAILRDIGFEPASWDFGTGGSLAAGERDKAVYDPVSKNWYKYNGALPVTVPAGFNPVANADWTPVTDQILRQDLASTAPGKGASLVGVGNGSTVQQELDKINARVYAPEDFGCDASSADNTAAVTAALTSGKNVHWSPDKIYSVTGIVTASPGVYDLHTGVMRLNTSRYSLGEVTVPFADKVKDGDAFRAMYVESAYDLCELAFIKSLGINTILHYGNFNATPEDASGSVQKVLDNLRALGMRMIANTEVGAPGMTTEQFITTYRNHPALMGWSTYDEAMSRGISYADQKARYDLIRTYSNKPVSLVDAWYNPDVISDKILDYYDIVLADPYPQVHAGASVAESVEYDLRYMRRCFGVMQAHSRNKKVIPVLGLAVGNGSPGATNKQQIISSAENFRKAGNGDFACFVWDGLGDPNAIISAIRANEDFRAVVKSTSEKKFPVPYVTESIIFGGNPVTGHKPLNNIIDRLVQKDPSSSDAFFGQNAYPVHLISGAENTDRVIAEPGWSVSGIGFKGTLSALVTDIPFRSNLLIYGEYNATLGNLDGNFTVYGSYDGGYSAIPRSDIVVSGTSAQIDIQVPVVNPNERLCIRTTATIDTNVYRRFFKGVIISCDW